MSTEQHDIRRMLLASAEAFLRTAHSLRRTRALRDGTGGSDDAVWRAMAENGWLGMCVPEELGGVGLAVLDAAELAALMGAALLPEPFAECAIAPAALLAAAPASSRRDALLAGLVGGEQRVAVAWQDAPGSLVPHWEGVAFTRSAGELRGTGGKRFVPAGADTWLATAAIDGVPAVLALDAGDRGVEVVGEQALADGSCWVELRIANASVAADRVLLIGDAAVDAVDSALTDGCVVTSAYLAGVAQGALNLTRDYLHQRVQFGQPIAAFQAVRHRIVDLELQRRLAFAAWRRACTEAGPRRAAAASAAKARCADVALLAARSGIQFHGAIGYTMEADIGLYLAAALRHAAAFGSASAHRRRFVESTVFSESPA